MNNSNNTTTARGGVGFFGLLTLVFIVLKLTGVISWSLVWVLAPLWIPFLICIIIIIALLLVARRFNKKL